MIDTIVTAGAYVLSAGRIPFIVGFTSERDRLGVVRPGGHRELHESGWACAVREVREEVSLEIRPLVPSTTYWLGPPHEPASVVAGSWVDNQTGAATPVFVAWRVEHGVRKLSVMYLAVSDDKPTPAAEAQGLVLLRRSDVFALAREHMTLAELRRSGGQTILRSTLPEQVPLEPFLQLRVLATLLARVPDLLPHLE